MNTFHRCTILLALAIALAGCATTGYKRAAETRSAIEEARLSAVKIQEEVDAAVVALTNMTTLTTGDLRPQYESLVAATESLQREANRLPRHAASVERNSQAYFHTWSNELGKFESPAIRTESAERRGEVVQSFQKIGQEFQAADTSLRPLQLHLRDMQRHLGTDLTASGVAAVRDETNRIVTDADEVLKRLTSLLGELTRLSDELSPVIPGNETAPK